MERTFGEYFKELRVQAGMTLKDFCKKNGFNFELLSKLESGSFHVQIPHKMLIDFALALGFKRYTEEWDKLFELNKKPL